MKTPTFDGGDQNKKIESTIEFQKISNLLWFHSTPESGDRETALRNHIALLKRDRAAISLHMSGQGTGAKLSSDAGQPAGQRWGHGSKDVSKPPDSKREKASLFYELVSVRVRAAHLKFEIFNLFNHVNVRKTTNPCPKVRYHIFQRRSCSFLHSLHRGATNTEVRLLCCFFK